MDARERESSDAMWYADELFNHSKNVSDGMEPIEQHQKFVSASASIVYRQTTIECLTSGILVV